MSPKLVSVLRYLAANFLAPALAAAAAATWNPLPKGNAFYALVPMLAGLLASRLSLWLHPNGLYGPAVNGKANPAAGSIAATVTKVAPVAALLCLLPTLAFAAPVIIEHHYLQYTKTAAGKYADTPPVPIDTSTCVPAAGGLLCPGLTMSLARLSLSGTVSAAVDPGVGVVLVYGQGLSQLGVGLYGSLATTPGDQGGALSVIVSILAGYLDLGIGGRLVGDTTVFDSGKNAYLFTSLNLLKIAGVTR